MSNDRQDHLPDVDYVDIATSLDNLSENGETRTCAVRGVEEPHSGQVLLDGVELVCLSQTHAIGRQDVALRFVALADRLYDRAIPVAVSGKPIPELFTEEMLAGGYRKKYLRAISRLIALSRDAGADEG